MRYTRLMCEGSGEGIMQILPQALFRCTTHPRKFRDIDAFKTQVYVYIYIYIYYL